MALGNESHMFAFSDDSTNVVPIHNLVWFPIDIFFLLSSYFISKYIDKAVNFHKEMPMSSFSLLHTILYEGFISKPEPS